MMVKTGGSHEGEQRHWIFASKDDALAEGDSTGFFCRPDAESTFYRRLPDLGVAAVTWKGEKPDDTLTVDASAQRYVREKQGKSTVYSYRVLSKSDGALVVLTTDDAGKGPNSVWRAITWTTVGDRLILDAKLPPDGWTGTFGRN